jgi:protease-4
MDSYEKEVLQMNIEKTYSDFVGKVAAGRKMTPESVDKIAEGHVWSGTKARELGLVDEIGGLDAAIKAAASLAGLDTWSVRELPVIEDPYTRLISQITGEARIRALKKQLGENFRFINNLIEISGMKGVQARLPYFIEIR